MKIIDFYSKYKHWLKYIIGAALIVICGTVYFLSQYNNKLNMNKDNKGSVEESRESLVDETISVEDDEKIFVYVCGEVAKPGVYECSKGDRVFTAIELAGGCLEDSDLTGINLAEELSDGLKIYVANINDAESEAGQTASGLSSQNKTGKVNINKAGKEELMTLTGIGESRADAIISYRQNNGSFKTIEDIKNVSGIKDAAFNKIKDSICV